MIEAESWRSYARDADARPFLAATAALFAVGVALRVAHLGDVIRIDEATTYVHFVARPWREAVVAYEIPNNHILNTILVKIAAAAFGPAEWALRFPNLVAGIGTMALTALIARRWFGDVAAVAALAVVAISPPAVHYAVLARGYGLGCFFGLLTLLAVDKKLSAPRPGAWAVTAALASVCALYALPAAIMFVVAIAAYDFALTAKKRPRALRTWAATWSGAAALTALLYAPVIAANGWQRVFANEYNALLSLPEMGRYIRLYGRVLPDAKSFGIGGPWFWVPLFAAGVVAGAWRRRAFGLLLLFCAAVIAAFFVVGIPLPTRLFYYFPPLLALGVGALCQVAAAKLPFAGTAGARVGAAAAVLLTAGAGVAGERANLIDDSHRSGVAPEAPALAATLRELPPVSRVAAGPWFYDTAVHYYLIKMGAPTDALDRGAPQAFTFDAYILVPPGLIPREVADAYFWDARLPLARQELVREVEGFGVWKAIIVNPR